jgi:hypothetical protein
MRNCLSKVLTQSKIRIFVFFPCLYFPLIVRFINCKHFLSNFMTRLGRTLDSVRHTFKTAPSVSYIYRVFGRNLKNFGRLFLILQYNDKPQNTYIQSWTVTEIMAREVWNLTAVTHLLINKFILKLAGICCLSNVNIYTWHGINIWVT